MNNNCIKIPLKLDNHLFELTVINNDKQTINIIAKDWNEYSQLIYDNTPNKKTIIQAGGNFGLYPLLYSRLFTNVFTFEPDVNNFYCLTNNCNYNNIHPFRLALSNKNEFLKLEIVNHDNYGMNRISNKGMDVYAITIDSMNIPDVSLIHLDLEGYEYNAILGAKKTIKKYKPTVVLELTDKIEEICDFMTTLSYIKIKTFGDPINGLFVHKDLT